jgi:hypothetical protein
MPGGSMGTFVMVHHPTLIILVESCITPFHHSSGNLNHFLILIHWDLWYCAIRTVNLMSAVPSLCRLALYVLLSQSGQGINPYALLVGIWAYLM